MDDILKRQAMKPIKPPRQCCGCGVLEENEQFLACSKCDELKLLPSLFCSQQCFKNSWKEHKKVHTVKIAKVDVFDDSYKLDSYESLVNESDKKNNQNDMVGAKKLLRKALKMDPRKPLAYMSLGVLYDEIDMFEEAICMYEQGLGRAAFVALTGICGDDEICLTNGREQWTFTIRRLLIKYADINNHPSWYTQDDLLMNVTKSAIEILSQGNRDPTIRTIYVTRFKLLLGIFRAKTDGFGSDDIPKHISPNDLFEAVDCFRQIAKIDEDDGSGDEYVQAMVRMVSKEAVRRKRLQESGERVYIDRSTPGDLSFGSWVVIKGLQSEAGSALNGKLGYIHSVSLEERLAVEVQDVKEKKLIKGSNLDPVPIDVVNRGIVACLEKKDQWSFMGDVVAGKITLKTECNSTNCLNA